MGVYVQGKGPSHTRLVRGKIGTATLESSMAIASTLEIYTLDPNFPHLTIYPADIHTHVHKDVCTKIFGISFCAL